MVSIFLVDDDENLHRVYKSFFEMKGHSIVASAYDGAQAVEAYAKMNSRPDILLMDYRMPIMDGVTATKEIKRLDPTCRIIFLSADETAQELAIEAGAASFLLKPVRFKHLLQTILAVLK